MVDLMFLFSIFLFIALTFILIKMGTTIKYEDIDVRHPYLFLNVFAHQYIIDPFLALFISIAFTPPIYHVYGLMIMSLTPSTGAASVATYTVDGDVPLALAMATGSLIESVIFTPLMFTLMIKLYSKFSNKEGMDDIELPYLRMFYLMIYVLFIIGLGYKLRQKGKKETVDKIGKYFQKISLFFLFSAFSCYIASKSFIQSMTPNNPYIYFGSMIAMIYGQLLIGHIPICNIEDKKKDASVMVSTRKSPGIALAIAAMSFQRDKKCGEVVGYILIYSIVRDLFTMPYIMGLRKKRIGHYFFSYKRKEIEIEMDEC